MLLKSTRLSLETRNHIDQIKNKPQDLLVNTSSGNRVLYFLGYRITQEFDSQEDDTNQSYDYEMFMYALIRLIQINQHSYQQSWQFSLHCKSVDCVYRYSSDNFHFYYLFSHFMLGVSNSNATMKLVNHKNIEGDKR